MSMTKFTPFCKLITDFSLLLSCCLFLPHTPSLSSQLHPTPSFLSLQQQLRKRIIGNYFWEHRSERLAERYNLVAVKQFAIGWEKDGVGDWWGAYEQKWRHKGLDEADSLDNMGEVKVGVQSKSRGGGGGGGIRRGSVAVSGGGGDKTAQATARRRTSVSQAAAAQAAAAEGILGGGGRRRRKSSASASGAVAASAAAAAASALTSSSGTQGGEGGGGGGGDREGGGGGIDCDSTGPNKKAITMATTTTTIKKKRGSVEPTPQEEGE
jgi:hypothetical protein